MSHAFVRSKGNQPSSFLVGIFKDLMCKVMPKVTSITKVRTHCKEEPKRARF